MTEKSNIITPANRLTGDELIKVGAFFTLGGRHTGLYTGDLFYNISERKFRLSGIPSDFLGPVHCIMANQPGPFKLDLYLQMVLDYNNDHHNGRCSLTFRKATVAGEFMAWVEENHLGKLAVEAARQDWEVAQGILAWVK